MITTCRNSQLQSHAGREPGAYQARRPAASPAKGRDAYVRGLLCTSALLLCLTGCAVQKELADARLEADESRLEVQALREKLAQAEHKSLIRAQRDRLAAVNEHLKRELAEIRERERQLRKNLGIEEQATPKAGDQTAAQLKELQRALANLRHSRSQWEQTLAERQRQIDVLTNQVERLQRELETAQAATRPATQPQ